MVFSTTSRRAAVMELVRGKVLNGQEMERGKILNGKAGSAPLLVAEGRIQGPLSTASMSSQRHSKAAWRDHFVCVQ